MDWIYFVILSSFTWGVVNVLDKFLIDKKVNQPLILAILIRTTSLIPLLFILPFVGFSLPGIEFIGWIFLAGLFAVLALIVYYKAIHIEEISRVIPLYQFIPVFVLFLSFFLIGEVLGFFDYVGFVILILGGLVISTKRLSRLFKIEKAFRLIVLSSLLYALSYVVIKHVLINVDYWSAFILVWTLQTVMISSLLCSGKVRKQVKFYVKGIDFRVKIIILSNAMLSLLAYLFHYFAVSLGPVTLVEAAGNIHLVFIFLLAIVLTRFSPNIIRERFDALTLLQKLAGMVLIIIGILVTQLL